MIIKNSKYIFSIPVKVFIVLLNIFFFSLYALGDKGILCEKTFGGLGTDIAAKIIHSKDNHYIVIGETNSKGAGNSDAWVLKLDKQGKVLWDKTYGGPENDGAYSIVETNDNGYIVCGYTWSQGKGRDDGWVFKINQNGKLLWEKTFGGKSFDNIFSVIKDKDGNYVFTGRTNSKGAGNSDAWVLKLDKQGKLLWDKTYGGPENDGAYSITEAQDNGYIVCGYTWSQGKGKDDGWIFKINRNGKLLWDKTFGGCASDRLTFITKAHKEGYIATGFSDREFCSLCSEQGSIWTVRISDNGEFIWENKTGGSSSDIGNGIVKYNYGYFVLGRTHHLSDTSNAVMVRIDESGLAESNITVSRNRDNYFKSIVKNSWDNSFFIVGDTWFESAGGSDIWFLNYDASKEYTSENDFL